MRQKITGVLFPVDGSARKVSVGNDLQDLYRVLNCSMIEAHRFETQARDVAVTIVCDEEGVLNGAEPNWHTEIDGRPIRGQLSLLDGRHMVGDFLVVSSDYDDDGDLLGLEDEVCDRLLITDNKLRLTHLRRIADVARLGGMVGDSRAGGDDFLLARSHLRVVKGGLNDLPEASSAVGPAKKLRPHV